MLLQPEPAILPVSSVPIDVDADDTAPLSPLHSNGTWESEDLQDLDIPPQNVCEPVKPKRFKESIFYPEGLSVATVSVQGKVPTCAGCHNAIKRGSNRFVKKNRTNHGK